MWKYLETAPGWLLVYTLGVVTSLLPDMLLVGAKRLLVPGDVGILQEIESGWLANKWAETPKESGDGAEAVVKAAVDDCSTQPNAEASSEPVAPVAPVAQVTGVCAGQRRTLEHTSMIILYDNPDILTHKTLQETASSVYC